MAFDGLSSGWLHTLLSWMEGFFPFPFSLATADLHLCPGGDWVCIISPSGLRLLFCKEVGSHWGFVPFLYPQLSPCGPTPLREAFSSLLPYPHYFLWASRGVYSNKPASEGRLPFGLQFSGVLYSHTLPHSAFRTSLKLLAEMLLLVWWTHLHSCFATGDPVTTSCLLWGTCLIHQASWLLYDLSSLMSSRKVMIL